MLNFQAANQVEATSPNSRFIHVMERRETDKGDPDHPGFPLPAPCTRKTNRKKARGEASCSHSPPAQLTQSSPTATGRERTQLARDAPADSPKQQASSSPGERADNRRGFNSISPQAWTQTEGLVIKLLPAVAMGTQATLGCRLIYRDENKRSGLVSARVANQLPKWHWRRCHLWQVMPFPPH